MQLDTLTDEELAILRQQVEAEVDRRTTLAQADELIQRATTALIEADGVAEEEEWTPRLRGFPRGWVVRKNGVRYESQISANVFEPGNPDDPQSWRWWLDLTPKTAGEWDPDGHAYAIGDEFAYQGQSYRVRQPHRSQPDWLPPIVPALYERI